MDLSLSSRIRDAALVLVAFGLAAAFAAPATSPGEGPPGLIATYGSLPIAFEPNRGQFDAAAKFAARGAGYAILLTADGAIVSLPGAAPRTVALRFVGVQRDASSVGENDLGS